MVNFKPSKLGKILLLSTYLGTAAVGSAEAQQYAHPYAEDAFETMDGQDQIIYEKIAGSTIERINPAMKGKNGRYLTTITVKKPSGKTIVYLDRVGDDYRIDEIGVWQYDKNKKLKDVKQYKISDPTAKMLFAEGQKRFIYYMRLIKDRQARSILD